MAKRKEPAAEVVITDVEQLKAISDPLRLQMIERMGEEPIQSWTAKELAERLGTKQTKLYHHLNLLEQRGFIRVAETRVVSGILEKRYEVVALSFRVDRSLFAGGSEDAIAGVLDAIFEKARNEILAGQRAGLFDMNSEDFEQRRMRLSASRARLSPANVRKVMRQIEKLAAIEDLEDPKGTDYGLFLGFYPLASEKGTDR